MSVTLGSLFSGYEGIGLGLAEVFGDVRHLFVADVCKHTKDGVGHHEPHRAPCSILAHHFLDVPNLGDVSLVDWTDIDSPDVLTAGFPCQDVSTAGRRAGLKEGTRTGLWSQVVRAIRELQPRMVVLENVPGIFTAPAAGDVEPCTWCVGDDPAGHLRALDAVLADLAALGFDAEWVVVPASGVGAAHKRERWFCLAWPSDAASNAGRVEHGDDGAAALSAHVGHERSRGARDRWAGSADGCDAPALMTTPRATDGTKGGPNQRGSSGDLMLPSAVAMLPTPTSRDHKDHTIRREPHRPDVTDTLARALTEVPAALLPTPAVNGMGEGKTIERWDEWTADMQAKHGNGNGNGNGKSLAIEAQRLFQTPSVADATGGHESRGGARSDELLLNGQVKALLPTPRVKNNENRQSEGYGGEGGNFYGLMRDPERWGDYAPAIARAEHATGRPAPAPTQLSAKGNPQLAGRFTEWLMMLPDGWITDVPGITRNEALKACGNGVVPKQCAEAVRWLWQYVPASVRAAVTWGCSGGCDDGWDGEDVERAGGAG